jgi:hypothetical protein
MCTLTAVIHPPVEPAVRFIYFALASTVNAMLRCHSILYAIPFNFQMQSLKTQIFARYPSSVDSTNAVAI